MARLKRKLELFAHKESKGEVVRSKYFSRSVLGLQGNDHELEINPKRHRTAISADTIRKTNFDSSKQHDLTRREDFFSQQYKRLRLIGHGVYGNVYLAQNISTSKFVAVKAQRQTADKDHKVPYVRAFWIYAGICKAKEFFAARVSRTIPSTTI